MQGLFGHEDDSEEVSAIRRVCPGANIRGVAFDTERQVTTVIILRTPRTVRPPASDHVEVIERGAYIYLEAHGDRMTGHERITSHINYAFPRRRPD